MASGSSTARRVAPVTAPAWTLAYPGLDPSPTGWARPGTPPRCEPRRGRAARTGARTSAATPAVVDTPVKAATNSPGAAAACWRSHVAIAGSDEDGSRPLAGLEDLDVRGVVDARQRGPVRARRVVRSGRPAGGVPSRSARPGWAQQGGRTPGTAPHAGRRASGSAPSARVRRRPGVGSRSQSV